MRVLRVHDAGVVLLHFLARDALVEVDGRFLHNVAGSVGGTALGIDGGVVDNLEEAFIGHPGLLHKRGKVAALAGGENLVLRVVVVDAVGEEHALGVNQEVCIFRGGLVNAVGLQNGLQRMAHAEVLLAVLVPEDVAAVLGGLREVVGVLLLLKGQVLPARNLVTHDLEVCKGVNGILEIFPLGGFAAGERGGHTCYQHHFNSFVHCV